MISRRPDRLGRSKWIERSKRPGRSSAGSRSAARFVAPITRMFGDSGGFFLIVRCAGSHRFAQSIPPLFTRVENRGASNDCSCTSSSFTTPVMPSPVFERCTPAGAIAASSYGSARMPERAPAIASISSMNPIAPPSSRAARRSSLKNERILRFVCP